MFVYQRVLYLSRKPSYVNQRGQISGGYSPNMLSDVLVRQFTGKFGAAPEV